MSKANGQVPEFKLIHDIRQRHVYAFEKALNAQGGIVITASSVTAGHMLKAAIEAGWVESKHEIGEFEGERRYFLNGECVDDMLSGYVRKFGAEVTAAYNKAVEIPPN